MKFDTVLDEKFMFAVTFFAFLYGGKTVGRETEIQRDVMQYLKSMGFLVWRNHTQGIRLNGGRRIKNPNAGQPDVWAVKNGRLLGVEVKTETGRLSEEQLAWVTLAQKYSVPIIIVHSLGELRETLSELWEPFFV